MSGRLGDRLIDSADCEAVRKAARECDHYRHREREPRYPIQLDVSELRLADVVELFEGPYGTGTVRQITKDEVIIARPYGVTGDFSYTGGVPFSVGVEECRYLLSSKRDTFKVFQRKDLR
jgi:hypothetical protein